MINGIYQVKARGTFESAPGLVTLNDGSLTGSDANYRWTGSYEANDKELTGFVTAISERGRVNVFGDADKLELILTGRILDDGSIEIQGIRKGFAEQRLAVSLSKVKL